MDGQTTNYVYDRNRLQSATAVGGTTSSYNYDPYGRLDTVVSAGEVIDLNLPYLRDLVDADPLVQRELARQRRDLDTLCSAPVEATSTVAGELRQRARRAGQTVFDFPLE
ncbi:MAG: hypothetical protein GEV12_14995 [Micromonosporaceae bacterium]|nr:hypothetical protein [Micromonosporaceae bacterium]